MKSLYLRILQTEALVKATRSVLKTVLTSVQMKTSSTIQPSMSVLSAILPVEPVLSEMLVSHVTQVITYLLLLRVV